MRRLRRRRYRIFAGERTFEQLRKLPSDKWDELVLPGTRDHLCFYIPGGSMKRGGQEAGSARKLDGEVYWRNEQDKEFCDRLNKQGYHVFAPVEYHASFHDKAAKVFRVVRMHAESRNLRNLTLIGHSVGGSVAASIFYKYSTMKTIRIRPHRLVLINAMLDGVGLGGITKLPNLAEKMKGEITLAVGSDPGNRDSARRHFLEHAERLAAKVRNATIKTYSGGHSFDSSVGTILRWITEKE